MIKVWSLLWLCYQVKKNLNIIYLGSLLEADIFTQKTVKVEKKVLLTQEQRYKMYFHKYRDKNNTYKV